MTKQKYLKGVPLAKLCAIIGDGHTEKIYFQALKEQEKPLKLTIKDKNDKEQYVTVNLEPKLPSKSGGSYKNVFEKAQELLQEKYDYIFCIIDYDTVLSTKQTQQYQKQKNALEKRGVVIVECNPCFEIWYLLHFQNTTKIFENCEKIAIDL